jgi:hypothetical protein
LHGSPAPGQVGGISAGCGDIPDIAGKIHDNPAITGDIHGQVIATGDRLVSLIGDTCEANEQDGKGGESSDHHAAGL